MALLARGLEHSPGDNPGWGPLQTVEPRVFAEPLAEHHQPPEGARLASGQLLQHLLRHLDVRRPDLRGEGAVGRAQLLAGRVLPPPPQPAKLLPSQLPVLPGAVERLVHRPDSHAVAVVLPVDVVRRQPQNSPTLPSSVRSFNLFVNELLLEIEVPAKICQGSKNHVGSLRVSCKNQ